MSEFPADFWIKHLQLSAHVEGGWYSEVYRSSLLLSKDQQNTGLLEPRNASTHIYFLLEKEQFSAFHRIRSDELWHFYDGDPLVVYEINAEGKMIEHLLGKDPVQGQALFTVIKAGSWFASRIVKSGNFSLVGCTVSPGFDFADFELANRNELMAEYPEYHELISQLCR